MKILVLIDFFTPRVQFIFEHILANMLGFSVLYTQNIDDFIAFDGPKISYSKHNLKECINIQPAGLLSEIGLIIHPLKFSQWRGIPVFFQTNSLDEVPFDIFSATFYLITRYEEYLPQEFDIHGRFKLEESVAYKNNFLDKPLIDLWVLELRQIVERKFTTSTVKKSAFNFIPTIDIDNAYAFKHKGIVRCSMGCAKSLLKLNLSDLKDRVQVGLNLKIDPFDTYENLFQILKPFPNSVWFILGGTLAEFDRNVSLSTKAMGKLVRQIDENYCVGVHPSYRSGLSCNMVKTEIDCLADIIGKNITASRQHYLKFCLPQTYRCLVDLGITHDYSMGYSKAVGFRASTCTPFPFYDLLDEKSLPLTVVPFQVMDRALLDGLNLTPEQAIAKTLEMASIVKQVGGTFVTVWHNESLSGYNEWKGWGYVFQEVVRQV
jgi:hypothetical protein